MLIFLDLLGIIFLRIRFFSVIFFVTFCTCFQNVFAFETSIMSFNAENFFDTKNDPNHFDETYLPLKLKSDSGIRKKCFQIFSSFYRHECLTLDWNEKSLEVKMKNLARTVLSVEAGQGPDSLILVEVENRALLKKWNRKYLKKAGYKTVVLLDAGDYRGINIGFLSRWELVGTPILHKIQFETKKKRLAEKMEKTRGVLELTVKTSTRDHIKFLAVHFPSQSQPMYIRKQALEFIKGIILKNKNQKLVVAGDFNISKREDEKYDLINKYLMQHGNVSHFLGCKTCLGTHFYKKEWSFLDLIFVNENLNKKPWSVLSESIDVVRKWSEQVELNEDGVLIPRRFQVQSLRGVSDHFPVYMKIKKN